MSELSTLLGNAAEPHRIVHEGKAFSFHLIDQPRKSAIEKRLYQQAREAVYADRDHMTPEQYVERLDRVREAYEAGEYSFYGERAQKFIQTPKGALALLEVITGESEDALVPLLVARGQEVNSLLKTVMAESFGRRKPAGG